MRLFRGALACAVLCAAPVGLAAQASLQATLTLHDPVTGAEVQADGGEPVRLRVTLSDPATGRAPRGVELLGWVRAEDVDNPACHKAAQNFRATRRTPLGAVDLNGVLVATLNRDATLSVVDPRLNLYSSNLVAAHRLDERPAGFAVSARQMRAYAAYPEAGRIIAARLSGPERAVFAEGLPGVRSLVAVSGDGLWAGDDSGTLIRLGPDGAVSARLSVGQGTVSLTSPADDENDLVAAWAADGGALLVDGISGAVRMRARFFGALADVAVLGDQGLIALPADRAEAVLAYADAPDAPITLPLGQPFGRIATGPDARVAVAYTPGDGLVALIDLALGRVVQSLSLTDATISEVAFTDNAAFLLSHDGGFLGALDLATVALGRDAVLRRVDLGAATDRPDPDDRLLVPMFPAPQVLAVEPRFQTGWLVGEVASTVEMPPMDSIRLRGGVPHRVALVDRSLQEVGTGVFETVWAFAPGRHELVLTTYAGELSTCVPFEVRGAVERLALTPVTLVPEDASATLIPGQPQQLAFRVTGPDDQPVPVEALELFVPSMVSGWRAHVTARAGADGVLRADLTLPHAGLFAVQPMGLPAPYALRSALMVQAVDP